MSNSDFPDLYELLGGSASDAVDYTDLINANNSYNIASASNNNSNNGAMITAEFAGDLTMYNSSSNSNNCQQLQIPATEMAGPSPSSSHNSRSSFSDSSDDGAVHNDKASTKNNKTAKSTEDTSNRITISDTMMGLGKIVEQFAETNDEAVIANRNAVLSATLTDVLPDGLAVCDAGTCAPTGNICCVCGGQAGKHTYYGAKACSGCRAFFRRAVQTRYFDIFSCIKKNGRCEVNEYTRRDCQYCRFQKCLKCGMKPSWVLTDSERNRRFNKRRKVLGSNTAEETAKDGESTSSAIQIKKEQVENAKDVSLRTAMVPLTNHQPIFELTTEDWNCIEKLHGFLK